MVSPNPEGIQAQSPACNAGDQQDASTSINSMMKYETSAELGPAFSDITKFHGLGYGLSISEFVDRNV